MNADLWLLKMLKISDGIVLNLKQDMPPTTSEPQGMLQKSLMIERWETLKLCRVLMTGSL